MNEEKGWTPLPRTGWHYDQEGRPILTETELGPFLPSQPQLEYYVQVALRLAEQEDARNVEWTNQPPAPRSHIVSRALEWVLERFRWRAGYWVWEDPENEHSTRVRRFKNDPPKAEPIILAAINAQLEAWDNPTRSPETAIPPPAAAAGPVSPPPGPRAYPLPPEQLLEERRKHGIVPLSPSA